LEDMSLKGQKRKKKDEPETVSDMEDDGDDEDEEEDGSDEDEDEDSKGGDAGLEKRYKAAMKDHGKGAESQLDDMSFVKYLHSSNIG